MDLRKIMVVDPKSGIQSVSLTLLVLSTIAVYLVGALKGANIIEHTSIFVELHYSSLALYFGRNLSIHSKEGVKAEKGEK